MKCWKKYSSALLIQWNVEKCVAHKSGWVETQQSTEADQILMEDLKQKGKYSMEVWIDKSK